MLLYKQSHTENIYLNNLNLLIMVCAEIIQAIEDYRKGRISQIDF